MASGLSQNNYYSERPSVNCFGKGTASDVPPKANNDAGFRVCVRTRPVDSKWHNTIDFQPRSGVRMQPTAKAVGCEWEHDPGPEGRKSSSPAHSLAPEGSRTGQEPTRSRPLVAVLDNIGRDLLRPAWIAGNVVLHTRQALIKRAGRGRGRLN